MDYEDYDGLGLAKLVRAGEVTSAELLEVAIRRLELVNSDLNAVITPMYRSARTLSAAEVPNGPFAGVPLLVKDLMLFFAGERLTNGSCAMRDFYPREDCDQARTIREAGFIVFGKTNCSELGAQPLTNPVAFGPTKNPWELSLNSGGSSGGSTAAVAARVVPMAVSSDGGGSIRLPASFCGVFGFKPSRGLNPYDSSTAWGGAVVSHVTTLSVRDSAAYLDWTSQRVRPVEGEAIPGSLLAQAQHPPSRLRIGFNYESPVGGSVAPECITAVESTVQLLQELGHQVEPVPLPYAGREVMRALLTIIAIYTRRDLKRMGKWLERPWRSLEVEPTTRFLAETGGAVTPSQLEAAFVVWREAAAQLDAFHQNYDLFLTPVTAILPPEHAALSASAMEQGVMRLLNTLRAGRFLFSEKLINQAIDKAVSPLPFLQIANATGQPAMSVPLYWTAEGVPIGSQFMAARGQDGLLLSLAAQLEQASPWWDKRPALTQKYAAL